MRRILGWALFAGFLGAVGVGVFHFVRYSPRCVMVGPASHVHLSVDGSRLATMEWTGANSGRGPLRVWNTCSGRVLHEMLGDITVQQFSFSPDGRHLAVVQADGTLRLLDWQAGREWTIDVPPVIVGLTYSSKGRWLLISTTLEKLRIESPHRFGGLADGQVVVNVATKQIALNVEETRLAIPSHDERKLLVRGWLDKDASKIGIVVWDMDTGKKAGVLPTEADDIAMSPDDRSLLAWDATESGVELWDLATFARRFRRELELTGHKRFVFSPDSRSMALWPCKDAKPSDLEIIDTTNGRLLWTHVTMSGLAFEFSNDGSSCALLHYRGQRGFNRDRRSLTMFDVGSGRILWEKTCGLAARFADTSVLVHRQDAPGSFLELLDAHSGELRTSVALQVVSLKFSLDMPADGRRFAFHGRPYRSRAPQFWEAWLAKRWPDQFGDELPNAVVMESATGHELFSVAKYGGQGCRLSEDGGTLLTFDAVDLNRHTPFFVRIWDVSGTRAWLWAIGASLGLGIVLRGFVPYVVRKLRKRKVNALAAATR